MTSDGKPRRAVRRRRTTRRLSRKPIPDQLIKKRPDSVDIEIEFDELQPTTPGAEAAPGADAEAQAQASEASTQDAASGRDMMLEDLEGDVGQRHSEPDEGPSYDDDALQTTASDMKPVASESAASADSEQAQETGPAVDAAAVADEEGDGEEDVEEDERSTNPELEPVRAESEPEPEVAAASEGAESGDAESEDAGSEDTGSEDAESDDAGAFADDGVHAGDEEIETNPRIDLTPEMMAAATAAAEDAAEGDDEEISTDPRIDPDTVRSEHAAKYRSDRPGPSPDGSVMVAESRMVSEPPPAPVAAEGSLAALEESLDELVIEAAESAPPETEASNGDAPVSTSKAPPPPPPSKRSKAPPPPPQQGQPAPAQRAPLKRGWWMDLFSEEYLQTVHQPTQVQVERQCDFIVSALGLKPGSSVLDVGCGLGWHAIELARRGCAVVGLDLSLVQVSHASEAATERGVQVNFLHGDMREMDLDATFDAVLCLGTTFGFFDDESNADTLRRLHRALRPGGKLLLDVVNRDFVIGSQPNLVWFEGRGCVCMEESDFNYFSSRLFVKRTVMHEDGKQSLNEYSLRLYSLHELGLLMQNRGFKVIEVSGLEAHRGIFFGSSSPRLIIIGERRLHDDA